MPVLLALILLLLASPAFAAMSITETGLQVQVDGAVRRPGVYKLRRGGRVAEAIAAAGGPTPGARLGALNLARALADGDRCHVPTPAEAAPKAVSRSKQHRKAAKKRATRLVGKVDVNHASATQLDMLPGVGPAMAKRILEVRQRLGRFKTLTDLREVPGIGVKRLAKLAPLVEIR